MMALKRLSKLERMSPREVEEGIKSRPEVTWDPFSVFPKEIYQMIFDKLEDCEDKRNFMNAHIKWYHLFKPSRVLFIFKLAIEQSALSVQDFGWDGQGSRDEIDLSITLKDLNNFRLVCSDWDKAIQNLFQLDPLYFQLDDGERIWKPKNVLPTYEYLDDRKPCKTFSWLSAEKLEKDLETFSLTHPPSKNPFLSRSINLLPFSGGAEQFRLCRDPEQLERYRLAVDTLLETYGTHIWHCKVDIPRKLDGKACLQISKWLSLMPELKTLELKQECPGYFYISFEPFVNRREIEDLELPRLELKNLQVLKSSYLPSLLFNKLFGKLTELETIQIKILKGEDSFLRDFVVPGRDKLKEAFLTFKGYEDFKFMEKTEPFPKLETLVISLEFENDEERQLKAFKKWPEWEMIFKILEEKFPALEDLTLRLPKALSVEDKKEAKKQSVEYRLNLPNLKCMWVALPNLSSLDFLLECKALEKLTVILEHCGRNLRRREEIKLLSVDFKHIGVSNVWEVFPKLSDLEIGGLLKCGGMERYNYWKEGDNKYCSEKMYPGQKGLRPYPF